MKKIVVANWKMNGDVDLVKRFNQADFPTSVNTIICPPSYYIPLLHSQRFELGAQNCSKFITGAYTGESSPQHLKNLGCSYVIVGHSERRSLFNEFNGFINKKAIAATACGLKPIICIGESLIEREENRTEKVLLSQLDTVTANLKNQSYIIAYEPVWSIGTGLLPTNKDIADVAQLIRNRIGEAAAVIYGGSVSSENAETLANITALNGVLVGGASLNLQSFQQIINAFQGD